MANSVNPDQTAPIGAVCSGSTLFASILNWSVMLGNYLQQVTSAGGIFRCIVFLALKGGNIFQQRKKLKFAFCLSFLIVEYLRYKAETRIL